MIKTKKFNQITTTENVKHNWQSRPKSQVYYPWAYEKDHITASTSMYIIWGETIRLKVLLATDFKETKFSAINERRGNFEIDSRRAEIIYFWVTKFLCEHSKDIDQLKTQVSRI